MSSKKRKGFNEESSKESQMRFKVYFIYILQRDNPWLEDYQRMSL
ncbi:hypothetical protein [Maledivibacter halophilus]|nr:hypothetical protein [Maledivibacter halophilus]